MLNRTMVLLVIACGLTACGNSEEEYDACLEAADADWEICADSCDSSYPEESDDAAWEACMNGCDQDAEFTSDDCESA
jgi:hypothetical protein